MHSFRPQIITIDKTVAESALVKRVLGYFPTIPFALVNDITAFKQPQSITHAKQQLLITRYRGEPVHRCQGQGDYVCCNYLTVSFVSHCHFECSYCILQDYLKNNPVITFYANSDEILAGITRYLEAHPDEIHRVGTGELSDSLALDPITGLSGILVPYAARQKNLILELKTKSDQVQGLLGLDHGKKTVVSWSVNPQEYISAEEHKCASLTERLNAARSIANAGYPVAFHLDPLLALDGWQDLYHDLLGILRQNFDDYELAWISLGSLRYTPGLTAIIRERFPKSRLPYEELYPTPDGKVRYFREIREQMYGHVDRELNRAFPAVSRYLCMETPEVWKKVIGSIPRSSAAMEKRIWAV